jgi:hypothetical protein
VLPPELNRREAFVTNWPDFQKGPAEIFKRDQGLWMSIRAIERLTGIHRDTIMRLGARVGRGCAELHDRMASFVNLLLKQAEQQAQNRERAKEFEHQYEWRS